MHRRENEAVQQVLDEAAALRRTLEEARKLLWGWYKGREDLMFGTAAFLRLATPAATPPHECPSCDLTDVSTPPGRLLATTPIKRPATPPPCATGTGLPGWKENVRAVDFEGATGAPRNPVKP